MKGTMVKIMIFILDWELFHTKIFNSTILIHIFFISMPNNISF